MNQSDATSAGQWHLEPPRWIESSEQEISGPIESDYILRAGQIHEGMFIICYEGPPDDRSFQNSAYLVKAVQYPFIIIDTIKGHTHTWDVRRHKPMLLKENMLKFLLKDEATPEILARQGIFVREHLGSSTATSRYELAKNATGS